MIKYTPEHMHCFAQIYGPLTAANTGYVAFQTLDNEQAGFRVAATGVITDVDCGQAKVVKKLKLVGEPQKIFKNTCFVKGMFNSGLEIAKFQGASIRTVSGIRGQIKRAIKGEHGVFRATFEDKVQASDLIFLRTWVQVHPQRFYNAVTNALGALHTGGSAGKDKDQGWRKLKTVGELRRQKGLLPPVEKDSLYKPIEREVKLFKTLKIPRNLQANLPFASKPKMKQARKGGKTLDTKRALVMDPGLLSSLLVSLARSLSLALLAQLRRFRALMCGGLLDDFAMCHVFVRTHMWAGAGEKRLHVLMQKVHTIRNDKNKKRKQAHAASLKEQAKRQAKQNRALQEVLSLFLISLHPPCNPLTPCPSAPPHPPPVSTSELLL